MVEKRISVFCPYCGQTQIVKVEEKEDWIKVECAVCDSVFGIANKYSKTGNIFGFIDRRR